MSDKVWESKSLTSISLKNLLFRRRICLNAKMEVKEEEMVELTGGLISSAKLFFRTRSSYSENLFRTAMCVIRPFSFCLEIQQYFSPFLLSLRRETLNETLKSLVKSVSKKSQGPVSPSQSGCSLFLAPTFTLLSSPLFSCTFLFIFFLSPLSFPSAPPPPPSLLKVNPNLRSLKSSVSLSLFLTPSHLQPKEYDPFIRSKVIEEILNTEKSYVTNLRVVKNVRYSLFSCANTPPHEHSLTHNSLTHTSLTPLSHTSLSHLSLTHTSLTHLSHTHPRANYSQPHFRSTWRRCGRRSG